MTYQWRNVWGKGTFFTLSGGISHSTVSSDWGIPKLWPEELYEARENVMLAIRGLCDLQNNAPRLWLMVNELGRGADDVRWERQKGPSWAIQGFMVHIQSTDPPVCNPIKCWTCAERWEMCLVILTFRNVQPGLKDKMLYMFMYNRR